MADAVGRHVNDAARTHLLSPFAWSDPEKMRELVDEAGFQATTMEIIMLAWVRDVEDGLVHGLVECIE